MKRIFLLLATLALAANCLAAAPKSLNAEQIKMLVPSSSRVVIPLAGTWSRSFDGNEFESVNVPFSETERGTVTYKRTIRMEKETVESTAWHLYFLGFNQQSEVYFNEQFVGRYYSGMSPIQVRIPAKMITAGNNELKIKLSPIQNASKQIHTQFINAKSRYSGLIREVLLMGTPPVWINEVKYQSSFANDFSSADIKAQISISSGNVQLLTKYKTKDTLGLTVSRSKASLTVENSLYLKSTGALVASSDARQITVESERTVTIDAGFRVVSPALWSPENPNLYELRTKLSQNGRVIDDLSTDLGLRSLRVLAGGKLVLNGQNIKIKGVVYLEDHGTTGQSLSPWRMEEDIQLIKTLGANAIRFKFNPPHPYFAALCDKYGIMMMIDIPMYFAPTPLLYLDEIRVLMKNYSKQYVAMYQNHPSLVAFCVSEGLCESDYPVDLSNELISVLKSNNRNLVYKLVPYNSTIVKTDGFDFIGIALTKDYTSPEYNSYYAKNIQKLAGKTPLMLSFGSAVQIDNHNGYSDPLSIEHQAYYIRNNYKLSTEIGGIGSIVNSFNDYKLDHPYLPANNNEIDIQTSGLVDRFRNQRLSYQMLQSLFNDEKEPLLNAGSFSEQTPVSFIIFGLLLVAALLFVVNRYRRFREYLMRSIIRPYNFYSDIRDQRIMSSLHTVLLGLIISFSIGMFLASLAYSYRMNEVLQYVLMIKFPSVGLQALIYRMIWMPEICLLMMSIMSFLVVFFISFLIKIFAFFSRARIYFTDCLIITIWSGIPYLLLLPVGIILVRLVELSEVFALLSLILFIVLTIWVIMRMLKASSVVFDRPSLQVYLIGLILLLLFIGIPVGIYQMKYSMFAYLKFFFDVIA